MDVINPLPAIERFSMSLDAHARAMAEDRTLSWSERAIGEMLDAVFRAIVLLLRAAAVRWIAEQERAIQMLGAAAPDAGASGVGSLGGPNRTRGARVRAKRRAMSRGMGDSDGDADAGLVASRAAAGVIADEGGKVRPLFVASHDQRVRLSMVSRYGPTLFSKQANPCVTSLVHVVTKQQ